LEGRYFSGYNRYREHCTICCKFVRKIGTTGIIANLTKKKNTTGIENIVSIVANLTRKIDTTGIKSIVSIVANLTGKKVGFLDC
jgi:hypothetical protein